MTSLVQPTAVSLSVEQVKAIYRAAIDAKASDAEGAAWWAEVGAEVRAVLAAPNTAAAAALLAWWHADWRQVSDSPARAAQRLRRAGARALAASRARPTR